MSKFLILGLLIISSCGKPIIEKKGQNTSSSLKQVSEDLLLETDMSLNFDLLPLKGEVIQRQKFWSGDSWRLTEGSINKRWNKDLMGFNYSSPDRREVLALPLKELKKLSPAEKYDLYMGQYHYPLKSEVDFLARLASFTWEGLCHGWAGASLNHPEPQSKTMKNPDGVEIPFGSSDIKALLSYAYSKILIEDGESVGKRCEMKNIVDDDFCDDDLTPASFHAVLANKLGLRGKSIIMDVDRYQEVWNHPIVNYESKIIKMKSTRNGKFLEIITKLSYVDVIVENSWGMIPRIISNMNVRYELTLDENGNMTGGKWLTRDRPDFIWVVKEAQQFEGYLKGVMELVK